MFAASDLNITQSLMDNIAYVEGGHIVERIIDCKFDRISKRWQLHVKWLGLDPIENSWEPLDILLEDVPKLVHQFIADNIKAKANVAAMAKAYTQQLTTERTGTQLSRD
ncbi:unnamed protein product [Aphanomyces euteiches]